MICPQTKAECNMMRCHDNESCAFPPSDSVYLAAPPKPTMAEIERLVDAFEFAVDDHRYYGGHPTVKSEVAAAKAALMAAIRAYGEGK